MFKVLNKNENYRVAVIADIHFGSQNPRQLYSELIDYFINELYKLDKLDMIVIAGDLTNMKMPFESEHILFLNRFMMVDLYNLVLHFNCKLRIIQGTKSHDNSQLLNYKNTLEYRPEINCKVILNVTTEKIDNMNILYLPEEYPKDPNTYYSEFFSFIHYDFIFGHGNVDELGFHPKEDNTEFHMGKSPVFRANKLSEYVRSLCVFGHYHHYHEVTDKMLYVGSFSSWTFDDEEEKGFVILDYNRHKKVTNHYRVINEGCTKLISLDLELFIKEDIDKIVNNILNYKEENLIDRLRLFINMNNISELEEEKINILRKNFRHNKDIIFLVKGNNKILKERDTNKENEYIFDKSITIEEKISLFIKNIYNEDLTVEEIKEILNK